MLPRGLILLPRVAALCCFQLLPRHLILLLWLDASLPLLQVASLPLPLDASYYLIVSHFLASITLQVLSNPPHLLFHYLIASRFIPLLPCCLIAFCWLVLPFSVATLTLGSQPKQGLTKAQAKREAQECGKVWEWTLTLPSGLPFWELESQWTPKFSESDCRGQNPLYWAVPYNIRNFLERRCLTWARMTHLDIRNTSNGQKKGQ
jgi:hypothetical protein